MKLLKLCAILFPMLVFPQEFNFLGSVETKAILANENDIPFWLHTNTNRTVGEFTNLTATAQLAARLTFSSFKINSGVAYYGRDGIEDAVQRRDLYLQFENSWLLATVGAKKQIEVLDGLSATNQNFLWSGNARPLPGIVLEASKPVKISKTFAVDWGIAHYQLNDERFVKNTKVHYKRLGLVTTFNENHRLTAQIQHFAQWDGNSPVYGKLKDGFRDFIKIFFASDSKEIGFDGEIKNAIGNHLGTYLLNYEFKLAPGAFSFYHEHPFEDGSGTRLANFPDGVWGLYFKPKNQSILSAVLYEYIDTSDQSGKINISGRDNYFTNGIYRSGWTYEKNVIGLPFILFDKKKEVTGTTNAVLSNRSRAHHVGIYGTIKGLQWKVKSTYAQYLGTYSQPISPQWEYWYHYGMLSYKTKKTGTFTAMGGVDFSNVASTVIGGGVGYFYAF